MQRAEAKPKAHELTSPIGDVKRPNIDEDDEDASPRKRQKKTSPTPKSPNETAQPSRKGRACTACRKLKVKCDASERGMAGCSRCQRLGLECINARRLRVSVDGDEGQTHPVIQRLERAVEEMLQKLKMPPLEMYSQPTIVEPTQASKAASEFQATRENSREPAEDEKDMAPAPMGSLYEVTQLNSLRSRLRRVNPRKRDSKRKMENDLISQKLLSLEDAEEMLHMFKVSLCRYLFNATIPEDMSLTSIRESSTVLFTAIMLCSALHVPGKEAIHAICHKHFLELTSSTMFDSSHNLDDIRGLCIAAFWQPDLSWKLSGLCIRMATELNLHHAFYKAFYSQGVNEDSQKRYLEKARLWYLLYVLDHHFSIAYGRPPVTAELLPIKEYDVLIRSPYCQLSDRRLLSQVSLFVILSKAYEIFGLEPDRAMNSDDATILTHLRFTEEAHAWRERWKSLVLPDKIIGDYPSKGVHLHHSFSELVLNSLALRGRSLDTLENLPSSLRPLALRAIEAAHHILQFFLEEASYRDGLVGIPLYLHSMIAFAVVFLMKMAHKWHAIGISTDPETRTKPLIEGIIKTLRECKAGANHMVYSMATGFERMLKQWGKDVTKAGVATKPMHNGASHYRRNDSMTQLPLSMQSSPEYAGSQPFDPGVNPDFYEYPMTNMSGQSYGGWSQDDMLWNVGMGYDLLAPNGHGVADFNLAFYDGGQNLGRPP